jgi:hypothetical protein
MAHLLILTIVALLALGVFACLVVVGAVCLLRRRVRPPDPPPTRLQLLRRVLEAEAAHDSTPANRVGS